VIDLLFGDAGVVRVFATLLLIAASHFGERLLQQSGAGFYYRLMIPLGLHRVALPGAPPATGARGGLHWWTVEDAVRWYAQGAVGIPAGLHGVAWLSRRGAHTSFAVGWCPPITPFAAMAWFAGLGIVQHQAAVSVPLALTLSVIMFYAYQQSVVRAVGLLRLQWTRSDAGSDPE